ncbi:MAG: hypothetical protein V4723_10710 [Pseudomonadota bacterium]
MGLFQALQFEWPEPESQDQACDLYPIQASLTDWHNTLYNQLPSAQYDRGIWPSSPELLEAMRAALADQRGNYAGDALAYSLVRCGCRRSETVAALSAWDAQLFRWSAAGFSARDLLTKFEKIGVAGNPSDEDLARLDGWLADPTAALANYGCGNITGTILKGKAFSASLYSSGDDLEYDSLFRDMASHAGLSALITNVEQVAMHDATEDFTALAKAQLNQLVPVELTSRPLFAEPETFWKIQFDVDGRSENIFVPGNYSSMNDVGLALHFDALMARLNRPERVMRFADGRNDSGSFWGRYIIGPPQELTALCGELGIPLMPFTGTEAC